MFWITYHHHCALQTDVAAIRLSFSSYVYSYTFKWLLVDFQFKIDVHRQASLYIRSTQPARDLSPSKKCLIYFGGKSCFTRCADSITELQSSGRRLTTQWIESGEKTLPAALQCTPGMQIVSVSPLRMLISLRVFFFFLRPCYSDRDSGSWQHDAPPRLPFLQPGVMETWCFSHSWGTRTTT